jgi:hypothetical protein
LSTGSNPTPPFHDGYAGQNVPCTPLTPAAPPTSNEFAAPETIGSLYEKVGSSVAVRKTLPSRLIVKATSHASAARVVSPRTDGAEHATAQTLDVFASPPFVGVLALTCPETDLCLPAALQSSPRWSLSHFKDASSAEVITPSPRTCTSVPKTPPPQPTAVFPSAPVADDVPCLKSPEGKAGILSQDGPAGTKKRRRAEFQDDEASAALPRKKVCRADLELPARVAQSKQEQPVAASNPPDITPLSDRPCLLPEVPSNSLLLPSSAEPGDLSPVAPGAPRAKATSDVGCDDSDAMCEVAAQGQPRLNLHDRVIPRAHDPSQIPAIEDVGDGPLQLSDGAEQVHSAVVAARHTVASAAKPASAMAQGMIENGGAVDNATIVEGIGDIMIRILAQQSPPVGDLRILNESKDVFVDRLVVVAGCNVDCWKHRFTAVVTAPSDADRLRIVKKLSHQCLAVEDATYDELLTARDIRPLLDAFIAPDIFLPFVACVESMNIEKPLKMRKNTLKALLAIMDCVADLDRCKILVDDPRLKELMMDMGVDMFKKQAGALRAAVVGSPPGESKQRLKGITMKMFYSDKDKSIAPVPPSAGKAIVPSPASIPQVCTQSSQPLAPVSASSPEIIELGDVVMPRKAVDHQAKQEKLKRKPAVISSNVDGAILKSSKPKSLLSPGAAYSAAMKKGLSVERGVHFDDIVKKLYVAGNQAVGVYGNKRKEHREHPSKVRFKRSSVDDSVQTDVVYIDIAQKLPNERFYPLDSNAPQSVSETTRLRASHVTRRSFIVQMMGMERIIQEKLNYHAGIHSSAPGVYELKDIKSVQL